MPRNILHCDMNNFYASVERMLDPTLKKYLFADLLGVGRATQRVLDNYCIHTSGIWQIPTLISSNENSERTGIMELCQR